MPSVRRALRSLRELDLDLWSDTEGYAIVVDPNGGLVLNTGAMKVRPVGRSDLQVVSDVLDVVAPFENEGTHAPDLRRPRPHLRIIPGKLSGAPHLDGTRLETQAVSALAKRGFSADKIARLYPFADSDGIREAIELEAQLEGTLAA